MYWIAASLGALLVGLAIVVLFHANSQFVKGYSVINWFMTGTIGIVLHVMGVSIMIDASKHLF